MSRERDMVRISGREMSSTDQVYSGMSNGGIAGIVIVITVAAIVCGLFVACRKNW